MVIEVDDLLGDVLSFEPVDISLTAQDAFFAPLSPFEHLSDSGCHTFSIIRCHIEIVGSACFLQTGSCTGHNGQSRADGFDDRYSKTFVDTWVNKAFCTSVEGWEIGIGDTMKDVKAMF